MDAVQAMTIFYQTIDDDGFVRGTISATVVNDRNRHCVVTEPLPEESLGPLEKWRWVDEAWVKCEDLRGLTWYDPEDTDRIHEPKKFDDKPPPGWRRWEPGENKVVGLAEQARKQNDLILKARSAAYPALGEQFDMLWHAMNNGDIAKAEPFYSRIKAVKDAYPKDGITNPDSILVYSTE
jgi:hypothetical protein